MKIGIDTVGLNHGRSSMGLYLISVLSNLNVLNDDVQIELFGSEVDRYTFGNESNYTYKSFLSLEGSVFEKFWHKFSMPGFARRNQYDIVFYRVGINCYPFTGKVKGIAFVHEIISETLKELDNFSLRKNLIKSLKKATAIIVSSEYIKNDLISLGIKAEKIFVVYIGIDHEHFYHRSDITDDTVVVKPFAIKRPFLIYPSSVTDEKKNHVKLIKGFSEFKKKTNFPHRLVLAGSEGKGAKLARKAASNSEFMSDIFLTGYFPHQNLSDLLSCSEACIFPSKIEGVGLPVLEAMASGIPVVCANAGALPEITAGNALFFDPDKPEQISSCIERILTDSELKEKLVENGIERAKSFTWEKNIEQMRSVIHSIYES